MKNINYSYWLHRWDRMQTYYNPDRKQRFDTLVDILGVLLPRPRLVMDIGCGTGSVAEAVLARFPSAKIIGIDIDFTLLHLARERMKKRASRVTLLERDLRDSRWTRGFKNKIDAVVSATALHWLTKTQLSAFYKSMAAILKPGGVFLNADHAGSGNARVQEYWDKSKRKLRGKSACDTDWDVFWNDYLSAPGDHSKSRRERVLGKYEGVEDGLPLPWHLESLSKLSFTDVDCYYRFFGDAIVGGRKT